MDDDWDEVVGSWVLEGSNVRIESSGTDADSDNLLIVDAGTTDYTIRAALDIPSSGTGLVFRYRDPRNYWGFEAIKYYGRGRSFGWSTASAPSSPRSVSRSAAARACS